MSDVQSSIAVHLQAVMVDYPLVNVSRVQAAGVAKNTQDSAGSGKVMSNTDIDKRSFVRALDNITVDIPTGTSVGILGLNGSGKSTLLRTIGGIIIPTSGMLDIECNQMGIFNVKQGMRMEATGRRNILLRGMLLGYSKKKINSKMDTIEEFSGLGNYLDLPISTYSTGMILRLAFSVCTAFKPRLLLLDEWIGTADMTFQETASKWLETFVDEKGSLLLASHSAGLLRRTCQKGMLLDKGKLLEYGDLEKVIKSYRRLRDSRRI